MIPDPLELLLITAVTVAGLHTIIGVDHSLPFVVLGRARGWSLRRVLGITALCGLGHVLASVLLGAVGIALGVAMEELTWLDAARGDLAAWLLVSFGIFYACRSAWGTARGKQHSHAHVHLDGTIHSHTHDHTAEHVHEHAAPERSSGVTWTLFILFVFGPCEALIPLLMAPAASHHWSWVLWVTLTYAAITIGTMLLTVSAGHLALSPLRARKLAPHADTLAGVAIATCGVLVLALGI